ncbi:MAG: AMIN domain-containing protein [Cyanobacteria bacterium P01_F01_bin.4]
MGYEQIGGWFRGSMIATALVCPWVISPRAFAQELSSWSFDPSTQQLEFSLPEGVMPQFFLLAEPARIVLDIPETQLGDVDTEQTYDGAVERIRVSQFSDDAVRIVVDLMAGTQLDPDQADIQFDNVDGRRQWRFRPLIAGVAPTVAEESGVDVSGEPFSALNGALNGADALILPPNLNADALQLSQPGPARDVPTELPIDPYAPAANAEVISVPALADAPVVPSSPPSVSPPSIQVENDVAGVTEVPPMSAPEVTENTAGVPPVHPASETVILPPVPPDGSIAANPSQDLPALDATDPIASSDAEPLAEATAEAVSPVESELRAVVVTPTAIPEDPQAESQTVIPIAETDLSADVPEANSLEVDSPAADSPRVDADIEDAATAEPAPDDTESEPKMLEEEASETTAIAASLDPSLTPLPVTGNPTAPQGTAPEIRGISDSKAPTSATPISVWPEPISFGQPLP